jgi:glycosyltransferase involved in cell wall biosynthesis
MDSHTGTFDRWCWLLLSPLHAFLARRAIWTATTNAELAARVKKMGAVGVIVEDIPFDLPRRTYPVDSAFPMAVVCSFYVDEPVLEVLEAARQLPDVRFYITGNPKKASAQIHRFRPENVTFTGWLCNDDYAGLLHSVSAVLVLTTSDFTMQRGGSEAITVGKPLITSDFPVLRRIFYKGTVHADNSPTGIKEAIELLRRDYPKFAREIVELREERQVRWKDTRADLERRITQEEG